MLKRALGRQRPFSPSVPAVKKKTWCLTSTETIRLIRDGSCSSRSELVIVRAAACASDSGESLHCFLVGANKSYVIATSDL